jgi:hypothetical protein
MIYLGHFSSFEILLFHEMNVGLNEIEQRTLV